MRTRKKPIKRSLTGIELEFNLIDGTGKIRNDGPELVSLVSRQRSDVDIDTEVTRNLVEIRSAPHSAIRDAILDVLRNVSTISGALEEYDAMLLPQATYPGKFSEEVTPKKRYYLQIKLFGSLNNVSEQRYLYLGSRAAAFHMHYTLPYGVFNSSYRNLKPLVRSKAKESLLGSYNMLVAADPAITSLLQSSPLVDGRFFSKDSRISLYRGGKLYKKGLYTGLKLVGALPPYVFTLEDLRYKIDYADRFWKNKMHELGLHSQAKSKEILDLLWNPVKINKVGTLESRSGDICQPRYLTAASILIKFVLRAIQQDFLEVKPSDLGKHEPFRLEGNTVHVPPITYVRHYLQLESAKKGFENKDVYNYSKRFFNFASKQTPREYKKLIRPLKGILERKKTVSDVILGRLKRKGYSLSDTIPLEECQRIALRSAKQMQRDLPKLIKRVEATEAAEFC